MIEYELTKKEKEEGRCKKTWDERTYEVTFMGSRTYTSLIVDIEDLETIKKILTENGRKFKVEKNIRLWW